MYVPSKIFFTKGVRRHKDNLRSIGLAPRNAGIEICPFTLRKRGLNLESHL